MKNLFVAALLAAFVSAENMLEDDNYSMSEEDLEDIMALEFAEIEDADLMEEGRKLAHWSTTSSTFRNGRNRRYGMKASSYYKLKSSVGVARHGEIEPAASPFVATISTPAFTTPDALTTAGATTMFTLGTQIAAQWADNTSWVTFAALDSAEVYTGTMDLA
mmetsp:Transcript_17536/g.23687  ORF Transcript_17536/g.23687 Transcript_17536/m.23687 type:complete len:162 (+) Transcript_17536:28-513(+)